MSGLNRYLRDDSGFRNYVEFIETLPLPKREKILQAGMEENELFVKAAIENIITFDRITKLPDMELTEVISAVPAKMVAFAVASVEKELKERLLKLTPPNIQMAMREFEDMPVSPGDFGSAKLKFIVTARELERNGLLNSLRLPRMRKEDFITDKPRRF